MTLASLLAYGWAEVGKALQNDEGNDADSFSNTSAARDWDGGKAFEDLAVEYSDDDEEKDAEGNQDDEVFGA